MNNFFCTVTATIIYQVLTKYLLVPIFCVLNAPFITHCFNISLFNIHLYIVNITLYMNLTYAFLFFIHIFSHIKGKGGFPQKQTWNKKRKYGYIFLNMLLVNSSTTTKSYNVKDLLLIILSNCMIYTYFLASSFPRTEQARFACKISYWSVSFWLHQE